MVSVPQKKPPKTVTTEDYEDKAFRGRLRSMQSHTNIQAKKGFRNVPSLPEIKLPDNFGEGEV